MLAKKTERVVASSSLFECEKYSNDELKYTKWLLTIIGVWPMIAPSATKVEKIASMIIIGINFFTIAFSVIPCIMFIFLRLTVLKSRLVFFGPMAFHISNLIKYICIMYRAKRMKKCINFMRTDWFNTTIQEDQIVMWKSANLGRKLTKICAIFSYSGGIFFHIIMTLVKPREINSFNVTARAHVLPGYDFFLKTHTSPTYEIIFFIHCLCATCLYTMGTAACNLAAVFVSHACGQVQIIKLNLQRLKNHENYENFDHTRNQITFIIKTHVKIIKFTEDVKIVLCEICLIEVFYSTVVICWLEFFCLTEWKNSETISLITYFILLLSLTFNVFVFCYIGEVLKNECQSVDEMTYMIDWYNIPPKNLSSFILLIAMARYPSTLSAGGLMELSIRNFVHVIKTSLGYFQMLRTVAE